MDVDDRIRTALGRAAPERPATGEVFKHVAARKARRRVVHRLGPPALAVAVVAASAGGYMVLGRVFAGPEDVRPGVASPVPPPSPASDLECPGPVPFEPGSLPPGFDPEPVTGPAPGAPPAEEGQLVIHYTDGRRSFEVRRPGTLFVELAQEDDAPTIRVLGTRTADFGPVEPGGDRYIVQFLHPKGSSFEDRCALFSLNEEGFELDELLRVAEGLRPITATLQRCPNLDGSMPRPPEASAQAVDVAVRFATALRSGDEATAAALLDAAGEGVDDIIGSSGRIPVRAVADGPVEGYGFVERDCGTEVADRSWFVIVDDGSDSASLDTTLFLILREDGWRIWGAY